MNNYQEALTEAARFMKAHDRFLIVSHVNPDGDTTSSALATALLLEQAGKSYVIVNEGETPSKFGFLPRFERILNLSADSLEERFDAVIAVDAADARRMGEVRHLFAPNARILNIDHHPTNDFFGTVNVIRTDAAATAEIMFEVMEAGGFACTPELATCLYTGLLTDTGGFRYSNTTSHVMEIAAKLLRCGVKPGEIAERCLEEITLKHVQVLRRALQSLKLTHRNQVASLKISHADLCETGATSEDASGLVNYGRNIEGVEVGISFCEPEPGVVKVSFRARAHVDVAQIAKSFGGGGHAKAAGCTLKGELAAIEEQVLAKLSEVLGVGVHE
ncbi:bifunctional oligoribonuclease/PAP phosphatase NrnA [Brevibacillus sp. SYP-B805]|uniref:DHH family phosphoesterase n=1 Tax=Brevibacillus sp. SYP-B805 TaxID=1578199 RepID=UPI0013ECF580|nr:bifunctional oligoribonuclease/PAP phosphatase NrnA [Brevibacillus sp. SYP-B805]NGQ94055.1 bifunctional oligoribonuclease/PAP phosphatase NrnA [Brevibacillus sp. SYP-B805]